MQENLMSLIDWREIIAFAYFLACWVGYNHYSRQESVTKKSLLSVTNQYRLLWMYEMLKRDNRAIDAIIIGNLMRSITFSANTTIFIIAGLLGVLTYHSEVGSLIAAIPYAKPITQAAWEIKLFILIVIFVYAYFKYTWSLRQNNYTSIYVAAAPNKDDKRDDLNEIANKGAMISSNAAQHFNDGQRAYYFGMAAISWFIHPYLFMLVTSLVTYEIHRREFRSVTLKNLLQKQ